MARQEPARRTSSVLRDVTRGGIDSTRRMLRAVRQATDSLLVGQGDRAASRLAPQHRHVLRIDHPPTASLHPRWGHGRPSHQALQAMLERGTGTYAAHLEELLTFADDLARIPLRGIESSSPCWLNEWLIGLDTVSLYGFTRSRRPARYLEVGSGQSTKVVARARHDGGLDTRITSIDPSPRAEVDGLCDQVHRSPLETLDLGAVFGELEAGDIVFFDGSHRVLPNSDCVAFFLEVLPSLPEGVLVGIHDIYLPDDYPEDFIGLWWSEQYALATFLLAGAPWLEVALPCFYASGEPDLAALMAPLWARPELAGVNPRGSAFWLQITGSGER